jgi:hypothetical protein
VTNTAALCAAKEKAEGGGEYGSLSPTSASQRLDAASINTASTNSQTKRLIERIRSECLAMEPLS